MAAEPRYTHEQFNAKVNAIGDAPPTAAKPAAALTSRSPYFMPPPSRWTKTILSHCKSMTLRNIFCCSALAFIL